MGTTRLSRENSPVHAYCQNVQPNPLKYCELKCTEEIALRNEFSLTINSLGESFDVNSKHCSLLRTLLLFDRNTTTRITLSRGCQLRRTLACFEVGVFLTQPLQWVRLCIFLLHNLQVNKRRLLLRLTAS